MTRDERVAVPRRRRAKECGAIAVGCAQGQSEDLTLVEAIVVLDRQSFVCTT